MTQEEKSLLLQDVCARLPYGVVINTEEGDICLDDKHRGIGAISIEDTSNEFRERHNINSNFIIILSGCYYGENIKPYLRPMSSMTEEELYEVQSILGKGTEIHDVFISIVDSSINAFTYLELQAVFEWFNAHHFDFRNLLERGLAIAVTEDNNPYKNKN